MKKLVLILSIIAFTLLSCKQKEKAPEIKYSIEPKSTTIKWTAFKTTEKIPVSGVFKTINITNIKETTNTNDALNGLEFSIPVNSLDSKNEDRDTKLINSFFGSMKDTKNLTGKIHLKENGKGSITLKMNGITKDFPISYAISGQLAQIEATIDLDNWQAKLAIDALNKVCFDKHKGADGISKTWNEVKINITSYLKVK